MLQAEDVLKLLTARKKHYGPLHDAMGQIDVIYDNKAEIPLPDAGKYAKPAVPNLLAQGVDQMAARIASTVPQVTFAAETTSGVDQRTAQRRAKTAQRTITGWWQSDRVPWKLRHRARHLISYGMSPVMVRYDLEKRRPTWVTRDPRMCYPAIEPYASSFCPSDVLFTFRRTVGWLVDHGYGGGVRSVTGQDPSRLAKDTPMLLIEHADYYGSCLYLSGWANPHDPGHYDGGLWTPPAWEQSASSMRKDCVLLERQILPDEIMQASVPYRIALNGPQGQFDKMVTTFFAQAQMWALEMLAVQKGIFPDTWLLGERGESPVIESGPYDGRTGKINLARGRLETVAYNPGYKTEQTIDRLERSMRLDAGIPSEFGGESGDNIRTARRGDTVLSGMIDHPLAEAQEVLALALADENRAAIALAKFYDGDYERSIYVNVGNDREKVTYQANQVFTHDEHVVSYPMSGTDVNSLIMMTGQRVGLGIQSKRSGMELDPMIANPELEHDRIIAEGIESSMVAAFQQQVASGQIPLVTAARVMQLVETDKKELADAIKTATEEALADQQDQQGPPQTAEQAAAPAQAAALSGSPIPGATPGQQDVADLLGTIRKPNMTIQPQRGVAQGAL